MIDDELEKLQQEFNKAFANITVEDSSSENVNLQEEFHKIFTNNPQEKIEDTKSENKKIESEDLTEYSVMDAYGNITTVFLNEVTVISDYIYLENQGCHIHYSDCKNTLKFSDGDNFPLSYEELEDYGYYEYTYINNSDFKYDNDIEVDIPVNIIYNPVDNFYYFNEEQLNNNGYKLVDGEVVPDTSFKQEDLIEFESYKNYDIITKCLDDIYKDLWDFVPTSVLRTYSFPATDSKFQLLIRFPEIKITNSFEREHTIKELYVAVPLKVKNKEIYLNGDLYGMRAYFSEKEYLSSYRHSHLPTGNSFFSFGCFCLGSGQIIISINNLRESLDDINFFSFLVNLKYYLTWESLEGGPHIKMENLNNVGSEIIKSTICNEPIFFHKSEFKITNITPIISNDLIDYDFNELEEKLTEWVINSKQYNSYLVNKDFDTDKYYNSIDVYRSRLFSDIKSSSNIIFKGSIIQGLVEKEKVVVNNSTTRKVIHPNYTNYVKREWIKRINDKYVDFKRNKKIRETYGLS